MITSRLSAHAALFALIATAAILYGPGVSQRTSDETTVQASAQPVVVAQLPRADVVTARKTSVN